MTPPETSGPRSASTQGGSDAGALILVLIAVAAFCGWYALVHDRPNDARPLAVEHKPLMPPSPIDTSSKLPGHTHYTVFGSDGQDGAKQ